MNALPEKPTRQHYIGGADIAAILGMSKWRTPGDVAAEKWGVNPEEEKGGQPTRDDFYFGTEMEKLIGPRYEHYNPGFGVVLHNPEHIQHKAYPFLGGSPDGMIYEIANGIFGPQPVGGLEIKNVSIGQRRFWGESRSDSIPHEYLLQCHYYMAVTESHFGFVLPWWDVAVCFGGNEYGQFRVDYDAGIAERLIEVAVTFWNDIILAEKMPDIDGTEAAGKALARLIPQKHATMLQATAAAEAWASNLSKTIEQFEYWEYQRELSRNKIKEIIGENEGVAGDGWRATWKANVRGSRVFLFKDYNKTEVPAWQRQPQLPIE